MMMAMNTAIAYVRVSTERQASEGVSLDAQRARIEAWCSANGYTLSAVYVDAGISGSTMDKRPELLKALSALKKGQVLVAYSFSRLARSTKDVLTISEMVAKRGADLVSLTERVDTTTAAGKLQFQMLAVLAEFERNLISERTATAMKHLKATRQAFTSRTPYGFERVGDELVEVQGEVAIVSEIRAARTSGRTFQAIADDLNSRGIATKMGKRWQPATVQQILKRTALAA